MLIVTREEQRASEAYKSAYDYSDEGYAVIVTRLSDGASVCLQGDDATIITDEIDAVDRVWAANKKTCFTCYEEHLDAVFSAYDDVMS